MISVHKIARNIALRFLISRHQSEVNVLLHEITFNNKGAKEPYESCEYPPFVLHFSSI